MFKPRIANRWSFLNGIGTRKLQEPYLAAYMYIQASIITIKKFHQYITSIYSIHKLEALPPLWLYLKGLSSQFWVDSPCVKTEK